MIVIQLYGHLAKKFGRSHKVDARTPREAIRALSVNFPGFKSHVLKNNEPGYHVRVGKEYRDEEGLDYPADSTVKIIPAVAGASAGARIILGAALFVFAPYAAGWLMANTSMVGLAVGIASSVPTIGMSLIMGGVAELLFTAPKSQSTEPAENKPGYSFDGPVNTVTQGNPIPICYGELIVGSQVISAGYDTSEIAVPPPPVPPAPPPPPPPPPPDSGSGGDGA